MRTTFMFEDWQGKHKITMKRASAEWANSDCPDIWATVEKEDRRPETWRVNSGGTFIEAAPEEIQKAFITFFLASSKAFYRKYPRLNDSPRNGFWANFLKDNEREYGDLIRETVGNVTPEQAF